MAAITWDTINKGAGAILSNGNLTAVVPSNTNTVRASEGKTSGKWYWELKGDIVNGMVIGIVNSVAGVGTTYNSINAIYYHASGLKYNGATGLVYGDTYVTGDILGIALDLDVGTIIFYKNGVSQGVAFASVKNLGKVYPSVSSGNSSTTTANFGAAPFKHPIPKGYSSYDGSQYGSHDKILLLSDFSTKVLKQDAVLGNSVTKIPSQSEQSFINHGLSQSDLASIDMSTDFTEKHYIQDVSTVLGSGKVFEQPLDINKAIKNISIK